MRSPIRTLSNPRGTADILPKDIPAWRSLEEKARAFFALYGYREIRTPHFEEIALFKRSLGETTEVVNKQLLEVTGQRSAESAEDAGLALRPEGTAPVVRAYNQINLGREEYISKLFYIGSMFRGERPQKGRLREFHQIGAEAIGRGASAPLLDAEMIVLAAGLLASFGVKGYTVKLNSLGSAGDKSAFAAWLRDALRDKIDGLGAEAKNQYERNVFRLLDSKDKACQEVIRSLDAGTRHLSDAGRVYFEDVRRTLDRKKVPYEIAPQLVRGLDYYTHTVFEITCEGLGAQDAVGAGGRYDGLAEQLKGAELPADQRPLGAMGFALGMERILLALEAQGAATAASPVLDAFVVIGSAALLDAGFDLVQRCREAGVAADMDHGGRAFKKQFEEANKRGARFALIIGEEEAKNSTVSVKNMATGEQKAVPADEVIAAVRS